MSTLLEKMMKSGGAASKSSAVLTKSAFFNAKEALQTELPIMNIAFSGSIDGGLMPGLTVLAGVIKDFQNNDCSVLHEGIPQKAQRWYRAFVLTRNSASRQNTSRASTLIQIECFTFLL